MSSSYVVQVGQAVQYRTAANRVRHAIVTAVTSQSVVDLRVGNGSTKLTVAAAPKVAKRDGGGAGWYRGSR
jgi:hypothetical protein